jgi:hypothetical protein
MQGIYHGGINASNIRIADDYTLHISDFEVSVIDRQFKTLNE